MFTTLISTDALAARLTSPAVIIVDCRFKLDEEGWGEREYERRHIPGALYAHLERDLSAASTGANGRHPLPRPEALAGTLGALGITSGMQVIAYDQDAGMYASRLWWLLRWLGHDAVAVLDGGLAKWIAEERQTSYGAEPRTSRDFIGALRPDMAVGVDEVAARMTDAHWLLIDARAPERFSGAVEPLDKAAGHIPGAANHFFRRNLDERGTLRTPSELRSRFRESIGERAADHVISYCGSGVTACHNLLALEHAGLHGAKLYPGSWSEWSADPSRPMESK